MIARLIGLCFVVTLVTTLASNVIGEGSSNNSDECTCVPYFLCMKGSIITDGTALLDLRARECPTVLEVCCKMPLDAEHPQQPPPKKKIPLDAEHPQQPSPKKRNGCGQRNPNGIGIRIAGADDNKAQFGEFPWMIALLVRQTLDDGGEIMVYACGGALIHEKVVLTAATCVWDRGNATLVARAGDWDVKSNHEAIRHKDEKVAQVIIHPGFRMYNAHNNFALLILENPFPLGENIGTVCLPNINHVPLSKECCATGWGKDKFGKEGMYQVILKKIDLPIVPKDQCVDLLRKTRLGQYFKLHESFVCAGGVIGKDTCKGDGGGPLVCPRDGMQGTYELTGITFWGIGCGTETPGVYGNVAYARHWIDTELSSHGIRIE